MTTALAGTIGPSTKRPRTACDGRGLTPGAPPMHEQRTCKLDSCEREAKALGYCNGHYQRVHRLGDPREDVPLRPERPRAECPVLWIGNHSHGGRLVDRLSEALDLLREYAPECLSDEGLGRLV